MSLGDAAEPAQPAPAADESAARTAGLRALAHPIRLRILSLLTSGALTAAEVARELGLTHANASYHLRQLHAAGAIQLAGEERIRGGVAKRYRYDVERNMAPPEQPPGAVDGTRLEPLIFAAMATELRRRGAQARRRPGNFLTDAEFWVDPTVWREIRDQIADASLRLHRAAQPSRTPGAIHVNATIALFLMED